MNKHKKKEKNRHKNDNLLLPRQINLILNNDIIINNDEIIK